MQIAILGRSVQPPWNEAVKNMAYELSRQLASMGHTVRLLTTRGEGVTIEDDIELRPLASGRFGERGKDRSNSCSEPDHPPITCPYVMDSQEKVQASHRSLLLPATFSLGLSLVPSTQNRPLGGYLNKAWNDCPR